MIREVVAIAKEAGYAIMGVYDGDIAITYKNDASPVTLADKRAHDIIIKKLKLLTPNIPIISEEGDIPPYDIRKRWLQFWLVDPLDGTKEFIAKNGEFTVNIALVVNNLPTLGVVYAPAKNILYFADEQGAFKQQVSDATQLPCAQKLQPVVVVSRSHFSPETANFIANIADATVIRMGSSLKMCLVAEGVASCYPRLSYSMEWDTAAAHAIVRYSGRSVKVYESEKELTYNKPQLRNPYHIVE